MVGLLFTDGGCLGNPGPGAWAWLWVTSDQVWEKGDYHAQPTTNNQMEWEAWIQAYETLKPLVKEFSQIQVFCDSQVVLYRLKSFGLSPIWQLFYVPGHRGIAGNERVNALVTQILQSQKGWQHRWKRENYPWDLNVGLNWAQPWTGDRSLTLAKPSPRYLVWTDSQHWIFTDWASAQQALRQNPGSRVKKFYHDEEIPQILSHKR